MSVILIIFMMAGSSAGHIVIEQVSFSSMGACQNARARIPKEMWSNKFIVGGKIKTVCVVVK